MTGITLGKLCQRRSLLAGLTLLCLFLPLCIGPAAELALSKGISFSGITLAVTGPEGDPAPEMLEQFMPNMSDVSQYCTFVALTHQQALEQLEQGGVTAVLVLPENFIQGIMNGSNPDVQIIVPSDRPLEALLTLWVGQSASDMLAAFQSGIYAVLEFYGESPPAEISYSDAVAQINLRYISWTMNRQDMFRTQTVSATEQLPIGVHYSLSLLAYFVLSLPPVFMVVYDGKWIGAQRRLRAAGRGAGVCFAATFSACWMILFPVIAAALLALSGENILLTLAAAAVSAAFCVAFSALCCLLTANAGSCGALSFSCSLVFLALSGGVVPPVLMPQSLRGLMDISPVTWLRSLWALPMGGYEAKPWMIAALLVSSAGMLLIGMYLYWHRRMGQEVPV